MIRTTAVRTSRLTRIALFVLLGGALAADARAASGTVASYDTEKGVGSIALDGGGAPIFVSRMSIVGDCKDPALSVGAKVEFLVVMGPKGPAAINVSPCSEKADSKPSGTEASATPSPEPAAAESSPTPEAESTPAEHDAPGDEATPESASTSDSSDSEEATPEAESGHEGASSEPADEEEHGGDHEEATPNH